MLETNDLTWREKEMLSVMFKMAETFIKNFDVEQKDSCDVFTPEDLYNLSLKLDIDY